MALIPLLVSCCVNKPEEEPVTMIPQSMPGIPEHGAELPIIERDLTPQRNLLLERNIAVMDNSLVQLSSIIYRYTALSSNMDVRNRAQYNDDFHYAAMKEIDQFIRSITMLNESINDLQPPLSENSAKAIYDTVAQLHSDALTTRVDISRTTVDQLGGRAPIFGRDMTKMIDDLGLIRTLLYSEKYMQYVVLSSETGFSR